MIISNIVWVSLLVSGGHVGVRWPVLTFALVEGIWVIGSEDNSWQPARLVAGCQD